MTNSLAFPAQRAALYSPAMTATTQISTQTVPLEKTPLERYVAPAKPSLVGLSREQLSEKLALVGVPERARKMRAQQIWHWLYVRGARQFDQMTSVSKELHGTLDAH